MFKSNKIAIAIIFYNIALVAATIINISFCEQSKNTMDKHTNELYMLDDNYISSIIADKIENYMAALKEAGATADNENEDRGNEETGTLNESSGEEKGMELPVDSISEQNNPAGIDSNLSSSDMEILYRITEAEAGGEDAHGRTLVANVILNRVRSFSFPNTIGGVVFDKKYGVQFSPTVNGRYYSVSVSNETISAVQRAITNDYSNGALYFRMTQGSQGKWHDRCLTKLFSYGCHTFYK